MIPSRFKARVHSRIVPIEAGQESAAKRKGEFTA
jgi:hypothetical protein